MRQRSTGMMTLAERPAEPTQPTQPQRSRVVVTRTQRMMATDVSAQIAVAPERVPEAQAALAGCFAWFAEVERRLSRFDPASELCALNRSAGDWFAASDTLYAAVFVAARAAFASEGLFNPTLLRRIEELGYDRDFALLSQAPVAPSEPARQQRWSASDAWNAITFDSARQRIRLPAGAALDLGGIAKGWAADVALERYCQSFPGALLNVGGDLRLRGGPQPGQPWSVGIRDPRDPHNPGATLVTAQAEGDSATVTEAWNRATLALSRGAVATSGAVRRWWRKDGIRYHHLLDPRTGMPLPIWTSDDDAREADGAQAESLVATVTALAPTGAQAEVATKVALARDYERALAEVDRAWAHWGAVGPQTACDAGVALIFTFSDGRVLHSSNLAAWLRAWGTDAAPLPMLINVQGVRPLALDYTA